MYQFQNNAFRKSTNCIITNDRERTDKRTIERTVRWNSRNQTLGMCKKYFHMLTIGMCKKYFHVFSRNPTIGMCKEYFHFSAEIKQLEYVKSTFTCPVEIQQLECVKSTFTC